MQLHQCVKKPCNRLESEADYPDEMLLTLCGFNFKLSDHTACGVRVLRHGLPWTSDGARHLLHDGRKKQALPAQLES